jgi:hypothetical protein
MKHLPIPAVISANKLSFRFQISTSSKNSGSKKLPQAEIGFGTLQHLVHKK